MNPPAAITLIGAPTDIGASRLDQRVDVSTAGSEGLEASRGQSALEATHHGTDPSAKFLAQVLEHPHHNPFPA